MLNDMFQVYRVYSHSVPRQFSRVNSLLLSRHRFSVSYSSDRRGTLISVASTTMTGQEAP